MKILQVNYRMNIGGIESFLMNIYRNIDKEKYEFVFLTYYEGKFDFEDEIKRLGGKIIRIPHPTKVSVIKHIKNIYKVIKKEQIDVVHCHTYFDSAYVMLASFFAKVKVRIVHSHTAFALTEKSRLKHIKWTISRFLINLCATDKIACSKEAGLALFKKSSFKIIPNGIDLEKFFFNAKDRENYRQELNLKEDEVVLGHIGRFDTPKNHKFLIEIFDEYLKLNQRSKLVLVGDGPLFKEIEELINQKKLKDKILLLGSRTDVNKIMNALDIIVFPSIYEGLPITLVETQANGLPSIISSNISKDIVLTDCIKYLSIKEPAKKWAEEINKTNKTRLNTKTDLLKSDYSIKKTVEEITTIYETKKKKKG